MATTYYTPPTIKQEEDDYDPNHYEMEHGDGAPAGSRRTRSQVAPDWTVQETMILVNEVSAVESEYLKTLASFQKWIMIVENCNALEVGRSLNQCRRKWDSLVSEYEVIKKWESGSRPGSYWAMDGESRRELGLPGDFDSEVFELIDGYLKKEGGRYDTDPDSDPEAKVDVVEVITQSVCSRKQKRRTPRKRRGIEKRVKPQKYTVDEEMMPLQSSLKEKVKPPKRRIDERTIPESSSVEDEEQMMAAKLLEEVELMNDVLEGNLSEDSDFVLADMKNLETSETGFARCQGDKLIACLGNISDALDRLCDLVQECG